MLLQSDQLRQEFFWSDPPPKRQQRFSFSDPAFDTRCGGIEFFFMNFLILW